MLKVEAIQEPWTHCPECNIGPGEDHKRGCSRGKWASSPKISVVKTEDDVKQQEDKKC